MIFELQTALLDLLKTGFEVNFFSKPESGSGYSGMNFHSGTLPPKQPGKQNENEFPFCVVNVAGGDDAAGMDSDAKGFIYLGAYAGSDDHDKDSYMHGYHEIQNITERVRRILNQIQILNSKFKLKTIKWQIGDENGLHAHPLYQALLVTVWELPIIERQLNEKELEAIL